MNMRRHHALLVIALTLIGGPGVAGAQDRPNIILIFSDDHALRAVSAYGDALIETPGIDRIADEGMLFRHAMVTNSICVQAVKNEAPGARTAESAPNSTPASLTELSQ